MSNPNACFKLLFEKWVVLGGLALSTVFTIFVIPSLLAFLIRMETPGSEMDEDGPRSFSAENRPAGGEHEKLP